MSHSKSKIQHPKSPLPRYERYKDSGVEWLGEVPEHWEVRRNLGVFDERKECNQPTAELLSVTVSQGIIRQSEITAKKDSSNDDKSKYKVVRIGDLAYNKMRAWQGALGISAFNGIVSPAYVVLTPRNQKLSKYFHYLYRTPQFITEANRLSYGLCDDMNSLRYEHFKTSYSPLPPDDEIDRIVAFLDQKTAEIDALITKKQRQIELLDEQKAILINRAVTRGLKPNTKLKPSGIEWIGEIPAHWEVLQLRRLQRYGTSITYGIVQAGPDIEDGIPYIRTSDMKGREFGHSGFLKTSHKIDNAYRRSKVEEGDLVIAIRATLGKALRVPSHLHGANLTQGTAKVAPGPKLNSKFLVYAFNSSYCQEAVLFVGKGTTFLEITLEALRRIQLVVPPIAEQIKIVGTIERAVALHRESVGLTLNEIQSLKTLRSTLIAHAVTGRLKVNSLLK